MRRLQDWMHSLANGTKKTNSDMLTVVRRAYLSSVVAKDAAD